MLRTARVVAVNPHDHSVDLVMHDDNSRYTGAQVLAVGASTDTGLADLVAPGEAAQHWGQAEKTDRDVIAVCAMLGQAAPIPVVLGFLYPQVCGMTFDRKNFRVNRHASNWYTTVSDNGDVEAYHPSGTFIRIGETPGHEDLTGQDFDKKWKIDKNTGSAPYLRVRVANAGSEVAVLTIDPSGNIDAHHIGNLTTHTEGNADVTVDGNVDVDIGGNLTATVGGDAAATVGGNTSLVTDNLHVTAAESTFTGHVTITAGLNVSGGDIVNQTKSVGHGHAHSGVTSGSSNTGGPV